jgi:hypothetical protein
MCFLIYSFCYYFLSSLVSCFIRWMMIDILIIIRLSLFYYSIFINKYVNTEGCDGSQYLHHTTASIFILFFSLYELIEFGIISDSYI